MTPFGDRHVTSNYEMPAKGAVRRSHLVYPQHVDSVTRSCGKAKMNGGQAYVVFPRIEGPGGINIACKGLSHKHRHLERTAVMHGGQSTELNEQEMEAFRSGKCHTLFCTSMIEVGVDVPNANHMIIHEAHMFGLSQLHQLRGRIGRGDKESHCYFMVNTDDPDAIINRDRVVGTDDGFDIAQYDLAHRGPGELAGNRQTGLSELKLVDLVDDFDLIRQVRQEVIRGQDNG